MTIAISTLVLAAAAIAAACAWLMVRMRDEYQMMHFMSPPASVSALLITTAVFLQRGPKPESFKALFITIVLTLMNAVVTHATARAFRLRQVRNDWAATPGDDVPELPGDERVRPSGGEAS